MRPDLTIEIAGLTLRNPSMLASGILGLTSSTLANVWEAGAGAVVTKSLGLKPQEGYLNPTIIDIGCGIINAMGLPNPGVTAFADEIAEAKQVDDDIVIIASVFGTAHEEFAECARVMEKAGVDGIELNVSCPHSKLPLLEIGQDPYLLGRIIRTVKETVRIPVFTKLSPNTNNICKLATIVEMAGGDGIVAVNTLKAMAINVETGRPILGNKVGGLSGPALKPVALRCVYEITQTVDIPVIGCGGILCWKDAIEFLLAGAQAIQIGSAIAYQDLVVFKNVVTGIEEHLYENGYRMVDEIIGLSYKY